MYKLSSSNLNMEGSKGGLYGKGRITMGEPCLVIFYSPPPYPRINWPKNCSV